MAFTDINPFFLSWQQQGLDFLLSNTPVDSAQSLCHARSAQPIQPKSPRSVQRPVQRPAQKAPQEFKQAPRQTPNVQVQEPKQQARNLAQENTTLPLAWQERLNKTNATPVLFSYFALGLDLYGKADPKRRDILKKIILNDLSQAGNTFSFWPVALPENEELVSNPQAFWQGIRQLNARGLVLFGEKSVQAAGITEKALPGRRLIYNNCRVLIVQDIEFIIEHPQHLPQMISFLKDFLQPFALCK